jgi:hypothetical protein
VAIGSSTKRTGQSVGLGLLVSPEKRVVTVAVRDEQAVVELGDVLHRLDCVRAAQATDDVGAERHDGFVAGGPGAQWWARSAGWN